MKVEKLTGHVRMSLPLGHVVLIWEILSNRLECESCIGSLEDAEKRAMWALEDLCERKLEERGVAALRVGEWEKLVDAAKLLAKDFPIRYTD